MTTTKSEIINKVKQNNYIFLDEYLDKESNRRVIIKDFSGYKYDIIINKLNRRNYSPNKFDVSNENTLYNIEVWLNINNSEFILCQNNKYTGINDKNILFYHPKCKDYTYLSCHNLIFGRGCGVCHGLQTGKYHSLSYLRRDLMKEWSFNNILNPNMITIGSKRKALWLCLRCNYEYPASIVDRTKKGSGCPFCSAERSESRIARELKKYCIKNMNAETRENRQFYNPKTNRSLPFDIYIPKSKMFIEIHGIQHYKIHHWHYLQSKRNKTTPEEEFEYQKKRDRMKRKFARQNGVYVEIDLRKIKTIEQAIKYLEKFL